MLSCLPEQYDIHRDIFEPMRLLRDFRGFFIAGVSSQEDFKILQLVQEKHLK